MMLLERLKRETQWHHQKTESDLNLFRNTFSLSEYRCLLERFLGYYLPWEHDVRAFDLLLLNGRSKFREFVLRP